MKKWFLLCSVLLSFSLFADSVNFISKPMSAGKASLADKISKEVRCVVHE